MEFYFAANKVDATLLISSTHRREKRDYKFNRKEVKHIKILNFDSKQDLQNMENNEDLTEHLLNGDPEIDIENAGKNLRHTNRLVVNDKLKPVYNYNEFDVLLTPDGELKERIHKQSLRNTLGSVPVIASDEYISSKDFIQKYVVKQSFFMGHTDGVSYKFLYEYAKKLFEMHKLVRIYAVDSETKKKMPIVIRNGGSLFPAAFIEGKIRGDDYCLTLLLVERELTL